MNKLLPLLVCLLLATSTRAASLGGAVELTPPDGWQATEDPAARLPTLRLTPKDDHNAILLVTLFPEEIAKITDDASLRAFHRLACQALSPSQGQTLVEHDVTVPGGAGIYATFQDPDLIGKPARPGDYKVAVPIAVWFRPDIVLQATLLTDEMDGPDLKVALAVVSGAKVVGAPPPFSRPAPTAEVKGPIVIHGPGAILTLPDRGFQPTGDGKPGQGYFSYASATDRVVVSGWLSDASAYKDFASFWKREKKALVKRAKLHLTDEKFGTAAGWSFVTYTITVGKMSQRNLRACRVEGKTWADLHLSAMSEGDNAPDLVAELADATLTKE